MQEPAALMKPTFTFRKPGKLIDGDLELVLVRTVPANPEKGYSPAYVFEMRHPGKTSPIGSIRLRIGSAARLRYPGHIGYEVRKRSRGHRYAARSSRLLLPLALAHGLKSVWLTVDPKNISSRKTCEIIGANYIATVRIPKGHEMHHHGARYRCRYRLDVKKGMSDQALPRTRARRGISR